MRNPATYAMVLGLCVLCAVAFAQVEPVRPKAELLKSIENGKALFNDPNLGTAATSCNSCHIEGGTKDGKMGNLTIRAFDNLGCSFPKYFKMAHRIMTLDQAINWCIVTPMKGQPLSWDDQRLADLAAYVASLRTSKPAADAKTDKGTGE